jgi:hypothetical protein
MAPTSHPPTPSLVEVIEANRFGLLEFERRVNVWNENYIGGGGGH